MKITVIPRLALSFVFLGLIACWEKQTHTIIEPEIPHYTLSGTVFDPNSMDWFLPGTPITIEAVQLLYSVSFPPVTIHSDSSGFFSLDTIYPGSYIISASRNGYFVYNENLTINHADRIYDLSLPKPLVSNKSYTTGTSNPGGPNPRFAWVDEYLWLLGIHVANEPPGTAVIFHCFLDNDILGWDNQFRNPQPQATGFEYADGNFYLYKTDLMLLDPVDFSINDTLPVHNQMNGLVWDEPGFWTTRGQTLQFRGTGLDTIQNSITVDAERLGPLTKSGAYFWCYDSYQGLILQIDINGAVKNSYRPIDYETGGWIEVHDLDFESPERLWVSDKTPGQLFIFHVPID